MAGDSEGFALGLGLCGALCEKVIGGLWTLLEKFSPSAAHWGNDATHAYRSNSHFFDVFWQADFGRQPHCLGAVVGENGGGGDTQGFLLVGYAKSIWQHMAEMGV